QRDCAPALLQAAHRPERGDAATSRGDRAQPRDRAARGDVVDVENVAELDLRVLVMAVVVFGEDEVDRAGQAHDPGRTHPTQFTRVAPPHVQLAEREPGDRA